jgi:carbamoyl-phosphate synthase large subunit
MKSTGEVMGIATDFGTAYYKAQLAAGNGLVMGGRVFLSISRREDRVAIVRLGRGLHELGFELLATEGTARVLAEAALPVQPVKKVSEGTPNILDHIQRRSVDIIINTPTVGRNPARDGYLIRRAAIDYRVPYVTTLRGAEAVLQALRAVKQGRVTVASLNEYLVKKPPRDEPALPRPPIISSARERP